MRNDNHALVCLLAISLFAPPAARAGQSVIWTFTGFGTKGSDPLGGLIKDENGVLFGTTFGYPSRNGHGDGTVYALTKTGKKWTQQVLYAFRSGADGWRPMAALVAAKNGTLYGTTSAGGATEQHQFGVGTVFQLTPPAQGGTAWTESVIYRFGDGVGQTPTGALILGKDGTLYGTTYYGGGSYFGDSNYGTVFSLTPPIKGQTAWTETTLYSFLSGADSSNPSAALVMDSTGALYGTTVYGGGSTACFGGNGCGTVFRLEPPAMGATIWTESTLYAFAGGADGELPLSTLLIDKSRNLYGTAGPVSIHSGVVFMLSPPSGSQTTWQESTLYAFQGAPDGSGPQAGLTAGPNGAFYGTTVVGGPDNCGAVYELTPPTKGQTSWSETVLYSFLCGSNGSQPLSTVLHDAKGNLFGTTSLGGETGPHGETYGTVFEIKP